MLLLANCEVHTAKYLDRSLMYGPNEMKIVRKTKARAFSVWSTRLVLERALLYSHNKTPVESTKRCRKVIGELSKNQWNTKQRPFQ